MTAIVPLFIARRMRRPSRTWHLLTYTPNRLRQTDVKAGHYERKVQALEAARDQWETKYEEMAKKYADVQKQLNDLVTEISNV